MTLLDHLEALRLALWRGVAAVAILLVPGFFAAPSVLSRLIRWICPEGVKLHYFTPMEPFFVQLKLGAVLAVIGAFPVILWALGRFLGPGLYPNERRLLRRLAGFAVLLFLGGAALGIVAVMPLVMRFSATLATPEMVPVIGIGAFVDLVALLGLSFGVMFQLPLLMVLLVRFGVVRCDTLRRQRPVVVVGIFLLAAILTPPDVVSQLLLALPCWLLFEIALWFCRGIERNPLPVSAEADAAGDEFLPAAGNPDSGLTEAGSGSVEPIYRRAGRRKRRIGSIGGAGRSKK